MADAIDAVAGAVADSRETRVDAPVESADQSGCSTRKYKYGDKTGRKNHQAFATATQTAHWQGQRKGNGRRKKKRGRPGKALLK
jgi:hypothetical protein